MPSFRTKAPTRRLANGDAINGTPVYAAPRGRADAHADQSSACHVEWCSAVFRFLGLWLKPCYANGSVARRMAVGIAHLLRMCRFGETRTVKVILQSVELAEESRIR